MASPGERCGVVPPVALLDRRFAETFSSPEGS